VTTRTLAVLRHAKSDWQQSVPDHDRPLAARGTRDAPVAGRWIAEHVGAVDLVVVSSALRTQQTWALVAPALPAPPEVRTEPAVYAAPVDRLLAVLREVPSQIGTVLLVGHNPGCADLVAALAGQGDADQRDALAGKYPTAGVAVLTFDGDWADLAPGCATLTGFAVPRG